MQRIFLSLLLIAGAGAVIAGGMTGAFFSDTETSVGNTFTAGAIDLKVDNESYYNGVLSTSTSWALADLDQGKLFFNFNDVKPDDEGEDTISLHINDNDAYACMDVTLTSNDDATSTDPELGDGDVPEDINDTWDGELAQNLQFFWWADDGDNVYEDNEQTVSEGIQTLYALATTSPFSVTLADSVQNVWNPNNAPGPIPGGQTKYIAKAWCFGNLSLTPVAAGQGVDPTVATGVSCDGTTLNNITQTDKVTLDVAFRAVQARHNTNFSCGNTESRTAKITVIKQIVNNNGGNNVVADYQLFVDNGITATPVTSGVQTSVLAGNYTVTETGVPGYAASFSGDCDVDGNITLNSGDEKTCTITNDDLPASITLVKNVTNNNGGTSTPTQFKLRVDGFLVQNNTSTSTAANVAHILNEDARAGYHFVSMTGTSSYGKSCPAVLGGSITLDEGEAITCTITNDDN